MEKRNRQRQERGNDREGGVTGWGEEGGIFNTVLFKVKRNRPINKETKPANESRYFKISKQTDFLKMVKQNIERFSLFIVTVFSITYKIGTKEKPD